MMTATVTDMMTGTTGTMTDQERSRLPYHAAKHETAGSINL